MAIPILRPVTVDVNAGPDLVTDPVSAEEDTPVTIDVLSNDDIGDGPATVTVAPGDEPANGSVAVNPDGTIDYTPDPRLQRVPIPSRTR